MPGERSEQFHQQSETKQENKFVRRPKEILREMGVSEDDYRYEVQEDGVHFYFKIPEDHYEERRVQMSGVDGFLNPTVFEKTVFTPFFRAVAVLPKMNCKVMPLIEESGEMEILVYKDNLKL